MIGKRLKVVTGILVALIVFVAHAQQTTGKEEEEQAWEQLNQLEPKELSAFISRFPDSGRAKEARKLLVDIEQLKSPRKLLKASSVITGSQIGWEDWLEQQQNSRGVIEIKSVAPEAINITRAECWEGNLESSIPGLGGGGTTIPAGNGTILVIPNTIKFHNVILFGDPSDALHLAIIRDKGLVFLTGKGRVGFIEGESVKNVTELRRHKTQSPNSVSLALVISLAIGIAASAIIISRLCVRRGRSK